MLLQDENISQLKKVPLLPMIDRYIKKKNRKQKVNTNHNSINVSLKNIAQQNNHQREKPNISSLSIAVNCNKFISISLFSTAIEKRKKYAFIA